jgi:hypothetical protein
MCRSPRIDLTRTPTAVLLLVLLVSVGALATGCGGTGGTLTINDIKLHSGDLKGWSLTEEVDATTSNAGPKSIVGDLFDAGAIRITNQVFEKDGKKLQVNFVQMKDADSARRAETMLKEVPGSMNTIEVKDNIAIEIIGTTADKELVVKKLGLSE